MEGVTPLLLLPATDSPVMTDFIHYNSSEQNTPKYEMKCVPVVCKANYIVGHSTSSTTSPPPQPEDGVDSQGLWHASLPNDVSLTQGTV